MDSANYILQILVLLPGVAFSALFLIAYGSHCLHVILEQTAAGNKELDWPETSLLEKLACGFQAGYIVLVCIAPVLVMLNLTRGEGEPDLEMFLSVGLFLLWLFFPFALLSSLASESMFLVFNPKIFRGMIYHAVSWLFFLILNGLLFLACFYAIKLGMQSPEWIMAFPAALILVSCFILYARLLGRLAWLVSNYLPPKRKKTQDFGMISELDSPIGEKGKEEALREETSEEEEENSTNLAERFQFEDEESSPEPIRETSYNEDPGPAEKKPPRPRKRRIPSPLTVFLYPGLQPSWFRGCLLSWVWLVVGTFVFLILLRGYLAIEPPLDNGGKPGA